MPVPSLLYTIPEVAQALAVSRSTVYRLIAEGSLEAIHIRGKQRLRPAALTRYLDQAERRQRDEAVGF